MVPDVLVTDIAMPGRDGYWLIGQVRALAPDRGGRVPAIAVTAHGTLHGPERARAAGFQSTCESRWIRGSSVARSPPWSAVGRRNRTPRAPDSVLGSVAEAVVELSHSRCRGRTEPATWAGSGRVRIPKVRTPHT